MTRHGYGPFNDATVKYVQKIMQVIEPYAFQKGGPIIALQFENEYFGIKTDQDRKYFDLMKNTIDKSGFKELLTNCDPFNIAADAVKHLQKGNFDFPLTVCTKYNPSIIIDMNYN